MNQIFHKLLITLGIIAIAILLSMEMYNKYLLICINQNSLQQTEVTIKVEDETTVLYNSDSSSHISYKNSDLEPYVGNSEPEYPWTINLFFTILFILASVISCVKFLECCEKKKKAKNIDIIFYRGFEITFFIAFIVFFVFAVYNLIILLEKLGL